MDATRNTRPRVGIVGDASATFLHVLDGRDLSVFPFSLDGTEADAVVISGGDSARVRHVCATLSSRVPDAGLIVVGHPGSGREESFAEALDALHAGADEYVPTANVERIRAAVERVIAKRRLRSQLAELERSNEQQTTSNGFLGNSPPMMRLKRELGDLLETTRPVTLVGERGTGKLTIAHALHCYGRSRGGPVSVVRCSRLDPMTAEQRLWGCASPPGAGGGPGLLAASAGGALLLHEVSYLPLAVQSKLASDLERRRMRRLGTHTEQRLDTRVLATSSLPLHELVETGRLRPELCRLLGHRQLRVPALRERGSDILVLAHRFTRWSANESRKPVVGLTPAAATRLLGYHWPGNVAELRACMTAAVSAVTHDHVTDDDLPSHIGQAVATQQPQDLRTWDEVEREHIFRVLDEVDGNKSEAARLLGISRKTLYRKLDSLTPNSASPATASGVIRVDPSALFPTRHGTAKSA